MVYEKVKVATTGGDEEHCSLCDREKSAVICTKCGHVMKDLRARKKCGKHPRNFFLMDVDACSRCKDNHLLEFGVDEIPEQLLNMLPLPPIGTSPPPPLARCTQTMRRQEAESPIPMAVDVTLPSQQSRLVIPAVKGQKRSRISGLSRVKLPSMGMQPRNGNSGFVPFQDTTGAGNSVVLAVAQPPLAHLSTSGATAGPAQGECICHRHVEFVMCSNCGYYSEGERKFIPCPLHPQERKGLKFCPECGVSGDKLDENAL